MFLTIVILLTSSARAEVVTLRGGPGEITLEEQAKLGVFEYTNTCDPARTAIEPELKNVSDRYLATASFPLPPAPAVGEKKECDPSASPTNVDDPDNAFHATEKLRKSVDLVVKPNRTEVSCVAAAQKAYADATATYRACPADAPKPGAESPCRSRESVGTMTRALTLVSECLGMDRRELFRLAAETNGMIPGAFPPRAEIAAKTVRDTDRGLAGDNSAREAGARIKAAMGANSLCTSLNQMDVNFALDEMDGDRERTVCERLKSPGGVFLPLYFQAKAYLYLRANVDGIRKEYDDELKKFAEKAAGVPKAVQPPYGIVKFGSEKEYAVALDAVAFAGSIVGEIEARTVFFSTLRLKFKGGGEFLELYRKELAKRPLPEVVRAELDRSGGLEKKVRATMTIGGKERECF